MKGKKVAFILLAISLVSLITGGVTSFLVSLKEDRALTLERMVIVGDEFEEFSKSTTSFELYRDELYNNVLGTLYYDTMGANDANIKNVVSNYESMVDGLEKKAKSLDKLCSDVYYPDSSVNAKCNNYKAIYEQVNNFFVEDIKVYNKNIDQYNAYVAGWGTPLAYYEIKRDYIDYNGDKVFDGKTEEVVEEEATEGENEEQVVEE